MAPVECLQLHVAIDRLHQSAERFEVLISRMEATARRECDCNLAALRRESERLLDLLHAHPPPKPAMLRQRRLRLAAAQGWKCAICGELLDATFHWTRWLRWRYDEFCRIKLYQLQLRHRRRHRLGR